MAGRASERRRERERKLRCSHVPGTLQTNLVAHKKLRAAINMLRSLALALVFATTANAFVMPATGVTIAAKAPTVSAPVISMGAKTLKKPLKKKQKVVKKAKKVVGGSRLGAPLDPAFDPVQLSKAIGLLGDVKDGFGKGQGIPTTGIVGVGVWILLVLRFTIFYGFFGE